VTLAARRVELAGSPAPQEGAGKVLLLLAAISKCVHPLAVALLLHLVGKKLRLEGDRPSEILKQR